MVVRIVIIMIHGYRWLIAPYLPPRCRFEPTCSAYAIHALQHHGLKRGIPFVIRRLFRCHPFKKLGGGWGYDPVPGIQPHQSNLTSEKSIKSISEPPSSTFFPNKKATS